MSTGTLPGVDSLASSYPHAPSFIEYRLLAAPTHLDLNRHADQRCLPCLLLLCRLLLPQRKARRVKALGCRCDRLAGRLHGRLCLVNLP